MNLPLFVRVVLNVPLFIREFLNIPLFTAVQKYCCDTLILLGFHIEVCQALKKLWHQHMGGCIVRVMQCAFMRLPRRCDCILQVGRQTEASCGKVPQHGDLYKYFLSDLRKLWQRYRLPSWQLEAIIIIIACVTTVASTGEPFHRRWDSIQRQVSQACRLCNCQRETNKK